MKQRLTKFLAQALFFLRCVFFLRVTPKGLRLAYADWCLAAPDEPLEIAPGVLFYGDQCTSVFFFTDGLDVAVNAAGYTDKLDSLSYTGVSIQAGDLEERQWRTVYRLSPPIFALDFPVWIPVIRAALRAKIKPAIAPLPYLTKLGDA